MTTADKFSMVIAAIALLCAIQILINTQKSRRIRQFPMVLFAFLFVVVEVVCISLNLKKLTGPLNLLLVGDFRNVQMVLCNIAIMVSFVIVKQAVRPIVTSINYGQRFMELFSCGIYEYDIQYDEWFLKKKWVGYRKYVLGLVCGLGIGSAIVLALSWIWGPGNIIWMRLFPCAVLVVLNEIYCYVNGQTKEEYEHIVFGEEADSRRVSNYYLLREIYEKLMGKPMLSAHTGAEFVAKETPADIIKRLRESVNATEQIAAEFFELDGRYKTADVDCVQATINMMNRRNVVFFSPFYRDLGIYVILPLVYTLLSGKKCTIICGRKNEAEDVKNWLTDLISEFSHMRSLWRVDYLSEKEPACEIGILTFTQVYDKTVLTTNKEFLRDTEFVLMIEPSAILTTGQIALSFLTEEIGKNGDAPVYCIFDRYVDGLIDTMSHLIHAEITDAVAMPVPRCNYSAILWDADGDFQRQHIFDKQTKYLGNGIELAAVAVKNQIPQVAWYSEKKVPVKDIKWISGQYHTTICRYMNQPAQQKNLYEKIQFISTLWSTPKMKEQFLIVEDEFNNMFSMMKTYLSRGERQVFVNVLSENYLLRDYMQNNRQMFMANTNAVPSYVPDYAKTERNTLIKLILTMTLRPVTEDEVIKEFHLVGIETDDAYGTLLKLLRKYTYAEDTLFSVKSTRTAVDDFVTVSTSVFSVSEIEFDKYFSDSLKNAYFILEEEIDEQEYIDAKLFNHVTQIVLPGQMVTYDGKYYLVKYVSPQSGVVLRRASDMFDGRKYYRQVRTYHFDFENGMEVVSVKKVMDIEFCELRTNFHVTTTGYLELSDNHDLKNARMIDFTGDPHIEDYTRKYRNKSVLRVKLPEADEQICFTFCLMLTEIFKTVYPDGWQYLSAVTAKTESAASTLDYVVYPVVGTVEPGYVYIVEDSDVDLGLLSSVEKNFMKLMEIVADFLDWYEEKNNASAGASDVVKEPEAADKVESEAADETEKDINNLNDMAAITLDEKITVSDADTNAPEVPANEMSDSVPVAVTEEATDHVPERNFLTYGYDGVDGRIRHMELLQYLRARGFCDNALILARKREAFAKQLLDLDAVNYCDFCSLPLTGVSYERLTDGRIRCNDCSGSAITTVEDFREIFYRCYEMTEDFFGIRYTVPISVSMADARAVAKGVGMLFKPETIKNGRVLGYTKRKFGKYSILIENGSPRLATIVMMVHELTHIWQFVNWNDNEVEKIYKMPTPQQTALALDLVYEGMAVWASIQYLYQVGESYYATQQETVLERREDAYGIGYRMYCERYPLRKDCSVLKSTPFGGVPTLEPDDVRSVVMAIFGEG